MKTNILDLGLLPSAKQVTPREWASPCPSCGGRDRFRYWIDTGRYYCRDCVASGNKHGKGDDIAFLMNFEGMSYPEACKTLNVPTKGKNQKFTPKTPAPQQELSPLPGKKWMERVAALVAEFQKNLQHPETQAVLKARGLTIATAQKLGIGWNMRDRYELCTEWGLPEVNGKNKIRIPKGLAIPTRRRAGIVALTIRQPQAQPKYWQVRGSQNAPYVVGEVKKSVFLLESALDAVLLWQEMKGQCAAVAFMGSTKGIDDATAAFISNAPLVIAVPDDDDAGHKAWIEWRKLFPSAVRIRPLEGKDLTDMHLTASQGGNAPTVQQWAEIALEIANTGNTSATKAENPTQSIGQDVSELKLKETQGTECEKIDFKDMMLFEICADPELTKKFLQHCPIDPAKMREDVSCPKLINGYRSKRDCLKCSGDKHCIMPILGNPFSEVQPCA